MTEARNVDFGFEVSMGVVAQFAMAAIGFVGTIIFARVLGPVEFGGFYLLLSLAQIGDRPFVGWAVALKKRLSEPDASAQELIGTVPVMVLAAGGTATAASSLFGPQIRAYTGLERSAVIFPVLLSVIVAFASVQQTLDATGRVGRTRWIDTVRSLLTFPAQLGFVLLGFGAIGMVYGLVGATILTIPLTMYAINVRPRLPSRETLASVWAFAKYSVPTRIVSRTYDRFDIVLIGVLLAPAVAGDYQVGATLTMPAVFISSVAGSGLMARVSNLAGHPEQIRKEISNTVAFASVLAIPIFFGAVAISDPLIVTIYGPEYASGAALLIGLALYRVLRTQSTGYHQALSGLDRQETKLQINVGTLGFNIVAGLLLALEFGAIGVVAATVLSETIRYSLGVYVITREIPSVDLFPTVLRDQLLAGVTMFLAVEAAHTVVPVQSWFHLGVLVATGGLVYFTSLVALSGHFRQTVAGVLRSVRSAV